MYRACKLPIANDATTMSNMVFNFAYMTDIGKNTSLP